MGEQTDQTDKRVRPDEEELRKREQQKAAESRQKKFHQTGTEKRG